MVSRSAVSPAGPHHGLGFNLAAIALVAAALGLAFAYGLDSASRQLGAPHTGDPNASVVRTVAGMELSIPRTMLRYDEPAGEAFTEEIDLRVSLPLGVRGASTPVDITLIPRSHAQPSVKLLDGVYLHQFLPQQLAGPPGLIGKPLKGGDGFEDEVVWYDALTPNPFVAKCLPVLSDDKTSRCLRVVVFDTVAAVYAFDSDVLMSWRQFDPLVQPLLAKLGLRPAK